MASSTLRELVRLPAIEPGPPPLHPGDHLDQPTFHRLYEAMPEDFKAELIGGVVVIPFSVSAGHADDHGLVTTWLGVYRAGTPGTRSFNEPTILLGPKSEPQPDAVLIITPELGGQTRYEGKYLAGPPELIVEVSYSSQAYDLHSKKREYEAAGVQEYVVVVLHQRRVEWLRLREGRYEPLPPGADGWFRSEVFPGLWLDPAALLAGDAAAVLAALRRGLESPEHAAFVDQLATRRGG
jgi:Uma2 family endonuclease